MTTKVEVTFTDEEKSVLNDMRREINEAVLRVNGALLAFAKLHGHKEGRFETQGDKLFFYPANPQQ